MSIYNNLDNIQIAKNQIKSTDGSLLSPDGVVLYFSKERFVKDICKGDCCFICGAAPESREFNNEHVLPRWILRQYQLFQRKIILPNGTTFSYDKYTIPCCSECNSMLGRKIEQPIKTLFDQGLSAVTAHISTNGSHLLLVWLSLLFIKTHLKDKLLKTNQDHRIKESMISDDYNWSFLHHIHCIARSFFTGCKVDSNVYGSLILTAAKTDDHYESFDFSDLYGANSIMVRVKDFALVAVLDDARGAISVFKEEFEKIEGALSPIQLREIMAHLSYINLHLAERPVFYTEFSYPLRIRAHVPTFAKLIEYDRQYFGEIMHKCCSDMLQGFENDNIDRVIMNVKKGNYTFLWDESGNFDPNSM